MVMSSYLVVSSTFQGRNAMTVHVQKGDTFFMVAEIKI